MNDELAVRISDLNTAADAMQRGTSSIRASVEAARGEIAALASRIDPQISPSFEHLAYSTRMTELADTLSRLADQLTRAAGDVEQAARWRGPALGVLWDRITTRPRVNLPTETVIVAPTYTLGSYLSRANRPLYDALLSDKDALAAEQTRHETLIAARAEASAEAAALRDRLLAYGQTDIAAVPRMQALETQIAGYDREISASESRAQVLETQINATTDRLLAVNPADSADVYLLRTLENNPSAPHILANTHDCVNYIASRVNIPDGLAVNAHLWDEKAAEMTHLGIRISETPLTGSILVMETDHPYADSRYGHVMLVEYVDSSGGIWVTDNNHATPTLLSTLTQETDGIKYLYLPWNTRA